MRQRRMLALNSLPPFYSVHHLRAFGGAACPCCLPRSVKPFWKHFHRHTQMCASMVLLNPIKLTTKIGHHTLAAFVSLKSCMPGIESQSGIMVAVCLPGGCGTLKTVWPPLLGLGCYWHLVGGGWGCYWPLGCTESSRRNNDYNCRPRACS